MEDSTDSRLIISIIFLGSNKKLMEDIQGLHDNYHYNFHGKWQEAHRGIPRNQVIYKYNFPGSDKKLIEEFRAHQVNY